MLERSHELERELREAIEQELKEKILAKLNTKFAIVDERFRHSYRQDETQSFFFGKRMGLGAAINVIEEI